MKLLIPCMECFKELGRPTEEMSRVEFCDGGKYEITCSRGHKTITILQQQKFEVLFDIGANAIIDGYYREAVSSFTASLERFYEFCIRVFLEKIATSEKLFKNSWKKISKQSERQLGAFIFLWTYCIGETPCLLPDNQTEFRNKVIHEGKIPATEEALKYGNEILNVVRPKMRLLKEKYSDEVQKVIFQHLRDIGNGSGRDLPTATMCISTIISLSCGEENHHSKTLEELLVGLKEQRRVFENK